MERPRDSAPDAGQGEPSGPPEATNSVAESSPEALAARTRWRRAALLAGVLAAALALYWALGTFVAPGLIQGAIARHDARTPGVELQVGAVHVQPFRLRVALDEVRVRTPDGRGSVVARRAELDWRPNALLWRAPWLARLEIEAPHAVLELPACCTHMELQQVAPGLEAMFARLAPVRLDRLEVNDGRLDLVGGAGLPGRSWRLAGLRIRVQDIAPGADSPFVIEIDDAAGMRLALDGWLAREARELRGQLVAAAHAAGTPEVEPACAPVQGTFAASLEAGEPALRLRAQWQHGAASSGESTPMAARLAYAPDHGSLELEGLPASALSGFAAQALGRGLAAGRIDFSITQHRVNGTFDGALHIAAEGLSLAPGADDGSLALALLVDAHDRLVLRAPLAVAAGDDLGDALAQALLDELARLGADPFAALGAVVGRPGRALQHLEFAPGSAEPTEALEAVLEGLAEALEARPGLAVVIPAGFHPAHDRDALAARQVELHVALATAEAAFRTRPDPLEFGSPRVQDVLDEFAGERLAARRIASLRARFTEKEDAAYYRALFAALVESEPIADAALERLARFRARAVQDGLAARGIAAERIVAGEVSGTAAAGPDSIVLRAELTPATRRRRRRDRPRRAANCGWRSPGTGLMLAPR